MLRLTARHPPPLRPPHSVPRAEVDRVAGAAPRRRRAAAGSKAGQALRLGGRPMAPGEVQGVNVHVSIPKKVLLGW